MVVIVGSNGKGRELETMGCSERERREEKRNIGIGLGWVRTDRECKSAH